MGTNYGLLSYGSKLGTEFTQYGQFLDYQIFSKECTPLTVPTNNQLGNKRYFYLSLGRKMRQTERLPGYPSMMRTGRIWETKGGWVQVITQKTEAYSSCFC
jgi:type 1 glutamine amidotransferase